MTNPTDAVPIYSDVERRERSLESSLDQALDIALQNDKGDELDKKSHPVTEKGGTVENRFSTSKTLVND